MLSPSVRVVGIDSGGHRERIRAERDELTLNYLPLVDSIARRVAVSLPRSFDVADLAQAGAIGLLRGAVRYRPGPVHPSVFLKKFIRGAILESVRRRNWHENTMEPLDACERATVRQFETACDASRRLATLRAAIAMLPAPERRIVEARLSPSEPSLRECARRVARITKRRRMPDAEAGRLLASGIARLKAGMVPDVPEEAA